MPSLLGSRPSLVSRFWLSDGAKSAPESGGGILLLHTWPCLSGLAPLSGLVLLGAKLLTVSSSTLSADFPQVVWCSIFLVTAALAFGGKVLDSGTCDGRTTKNLNPKP